MTTPPPVEPIQNFEPSPQAPQPQAASPNASASNKQHLQKLVGILLVSLIAGAYFAYDVYQREKNSVAPNLQPTLERKAELKARLAQPKKLVTGTVIRHADDLQLVTGQNTRLDLTETKNIDRYDYYPATGLVAYTHGERQAVDGSDYTEIHPTQATLLDLATKTTKPIIDFKPEIPSQDAPLFKDQIRDVSFSNDGTLIALTTSQSLYIYNVETGVTDQIFYNQYTQTNAAGILSYREPVISPDNTKVYVVTQEIERKGYLFIDLETGAQTQTDLYNSFSHSYEILDWVDSNQVLVTFSGDQPVSEKKIPEIFLYSFATQSSKPVIGDIETGYVTEGVITGPNEAHLLIDTYNPETQKTKHAIAKLDLSDSTITQLFQFYQLTGSTQEFVHGLEINGDTARIKVSSPPTTRPKTRSDEMDEALYEAQMSAGTMKRVSL